MMIVLFLKPFHSIQLSDFKYICNAVKPSPLSSFGIVSSPQKETPYLLSVIPPFLLPHFLEAISLLSVSMDLPVLDISYK